MTQVSPVCRLVYRTVQSCVRPSAVQLSMERHCRQRARADTGATQLNSSRSGRRLKVIETPAVGTGVSCCRDRIVSGHMMETVTAKLPIDEILFTLCIVQLINFCIFLVKIIHFMFNSFWSLFSNYFLPTFPIIYHDFLPAPRRVVMSSQIKHTQSLRYTP